MKPRSLISRTTILVGLLGLSAMVHQTVATASSDNLTIIEKNSKNAYMLHGDNLKTWVTSDCASVLEGLGVPRRTGTWDADLQHRTTVSIGCDALKAKVKSEPSSGNLYRQLHQGEYW